MLHPHTELRHINQALGYGVVATRLIPRGTIIWVLDKLDQTFTRLRLRTSVSHIRNCSTNGPISYRTAILF